MKNILFYTFIIILIFSCNIDNKNSGATLEPTNERINIKLGKKEINNTILSQYFSDRDSNYLAILNNNHNSIYIYNLDNKRLLKEIIINVEGPDAFPGAFGFVIKNLDTIILISNFPPRVGILNGEGKIQKTIACQDENGSWLSLAIPLHGERGILTGNILNIVQNLHVQKYDGKLTSYDQKQLKVAASINIENGNVKSLPLNYPEKLVGKDVFNMTNCWVQGYNNCFIYSFSILGVLFVTQDFSSFREISFESDYQLKLPENMFKYSTDLEGFLKYQMETDVIWSLYYDKYRELYYILVRKRYPDQDIKEPDPAMAVYPNCFIIMLDKNFKRLGDVHFPENTYSFNNIFITNRGLYISEDNVDNPTYSEDAMRFRLFKPIKLNENEK